MKKILLFLCFVQIVLLGIWCISWHYKSFPSFKPKPLFFAYPVVVSPPKASAQIADNVIRHGRRESRKIALSFDADMTPKEKDEADSGLKKAFFDKQIVEILTKERVPATFFLSGLWAETYPEAVRQIAKNPRFEIGSHSYSHQFFAPLAPAQL